MIRLKPEERKRTIRVMLGDLVTRWICHYGEWNTSALLKDLERELKLRRKQR